MPSGWLCQKALWSLRALGTEGKWKFPSWPDLGGLRGRTAPFLPSGHICPDFPVSLYPRNGGGRGTALRVLPIRERILYRPLYPYPPCTLV